MVALPSQKKKIPIFWVFIFAECQALGKTFTECPIKNTRQKPLCRPEICRVLFIECGTR